MKLFTFLTVLLYFQHSSIACETTDPLSLLPSVDLHFGMGDVSEHKCENYKGLSRLNFSFSTDSEVNEYYNQYVNENENELNKSTTFWAQEFIGADLVKDEVASGDTISIAILDSGFDGYDLKSVKHVKYTADPEYPDNHGSHTANITRSDSLISSSAVGKINHLFQINEAADYQEAFKSFKSNETPHVINNSMIYWTEDEASEALKNMRESGSLFVASGGNHFPYNHDTSESTAQNVLSVGWVDTNGLYHPSSTDSIQLDLVAPSGMSLTSISNSGGYSLFGGSSGSTPLVAGAAANIISALGVRSPEVVETILKKSAYRYPMRNDRNGAGLLNSYKAFKVAKRLREICNQDKTCLAREASNSDNYMFDEDFASAKNSILSEIPSCKNDQPTITKMNSCALDSHIKTLRKAFSLSQSKTIGALLSCLYDSLGFSKNAEFYRNYSKEKLELEELSPEQFFRHLPYSQGIESGVILRKATAILENEVDNEQIKRQINMILYGIKDRKLSEVRNIVRLLVSKLPQDETYELDMNSLFDDTETVKAVVTELIKKRKIPESSTLPMLRCYEKFALNSNIYTEAAKEAGINVSDHFMTKESCSLMLEGILEI